MARQSAAGKLVQHVQRMIAEFGGDNGNGVDPEAMVAVLSSLRDWPDTSVDFATFAADREGMPRWAFRVDIPVGQLHDLILDMVNSDVADSFFTGFAAAWRSRGLSRRWTADR